MHVTEQVFCSKVKQNIVFYAASQRSQSVKKIHYTTFYVKSERFLLYRPSWTRKNAEKVCYMAKENASTEILVFWYFSLASLKKKLFVYQKNGFGPKKNILNLLDCSSSYNTATIQICM